jgi:protein-arginine kinase activator protein McsA
VPARQPEDTKKQVELMELRRQLEDAVKAEDYETAAQLRDKIGQSE